MSLHYSTMLVSAQHEHPEFRLRHKRFAIVDRGAFDPKFRVGGSVESGYFAVADPFGCGDRAQTPEMAIMSLLSAHGCTTVTVRDAVQHQKDMDDFQMFHSACEKHVDLPSNPWYRNLHHGRVPIGWTDMEITGVINRRFPADLCAHIEDPCRHWHASVPQWSPIDHLSSDEEIAILVTQKFTRHD